MCRSCSTGPPVTRFIEELLAAPVPVTALPEGLRGVLLTRLRDPPDPVLPVLRPASVLGQGFTEDLLAAATGLPLPQIEDVLRRLAADHNILRATAAGRGAFTLGQGPKRPARTVHVRPLRCLGVHRDCYSVGYPPSRDGASHPQPRGARLTQSIGCHNIATD